MTKLLAPFASLRLTVALLAASMLLVFAGTLAQVEQTNFAAVTDYFRSLYVLIPVRLFAELFNGNQKIDWAWVLPWPGGLTLGTLLAINLLAAHAVRFKFSAKRVGIILIHLGLIALLAGEFVTGLAAREWQMTVPVGQYANYAEDIRASELAVVDGSDPEFDRTVAIPEAALMKAALTREPIRDDALRFDIRVDRWMANAFVVGPAQVPDEIRARHADVLGVGDTLFPVEEPEASGVEQQIADAPAAYLTLLDKQTGQPLARYMVARAINAPQPVELPEAGVDASDGLTIELRFARGYKDYEIHVAQFDFDFFPGTETPTQFVSTGRLIDPRFGEDRPFRIAMNEPLRYRGDALFQASYMPDGSATVLQIVRNPGWTLPYIACGLVTAGLAFHFGLMMWTQMRKRRTASAPTRTPDGATPAEHAPPSHAGFARWAVPAATLALALILIGGQLRPTTPNAPFDLRTAGQIPVSGDGRVKPLESEARATLLTLSNKTTVDRQGERISATQWFFDLLASPERTFQDPVIRIDHPGVKDLIGIADHERKLFTPEEVFAHIEAIQEQAEQAQAVRARDRSGFQRHVIDLLGKTNRLAEIRLMQRPYVIAPLDRETRWQPLSVAMHAAHADVDPAAHVGHDHPAFNLRSAEAWASLLQTYSAQAPAAFNATAKAYLAEFDQALPRDASRASVEGLFNAFNPFYQGIVLYVLGGLLVFAAWIATGAGATRASAALLRSSVWLIGFTLLLHTLGLIARIYITGRPPVTNLYSSAVFIGWAAVILGLILERFSRTGLGALLAACVGTSTLIVALNLAIADGDTKQMMQAVLDTNFWLATHVITITLGYAATFAAGFLGIAYLLTGVYTRLLTRARAKAIYTMMYGTIAFALLFSFAGTVLGGIWADQSWGRFWGWDPKENGAILIVLIQAIILHARWGGMIQARGFAVLATFGNIITAWSWFGTNMLGVGLHSYGFMESGMFWLGVFALLNLAIMAAGLLPVSRWASAEFLVKRTGGGNAPKPNAVAPA